MQLKKRIGDLFESFSSQRAQTHEDYLMIMGEMLLSSKMNLWDTESFPFVPSN